MSNPSSQNNSPILSTKELLQQLHDISGHLRSLQEGRQEDRAQLEAAMRAVQSDQAALRQELRGAPKPGPAAPPPLAPTPSATFSNGERQGPEATPALPPPQLLPQRRPLPAGEPFDGSKTMYPAWCRHMLYCLERDALFIGGGVDQFHCIYASLTAAV